LIGLAVLALVLTMAVGGIWAALLVVNLSRSPAVPWSVFVMALILWMIWRYLDGRWPPRSTSEARRRSLRARRLPGRVFAWAVVAGLLSIVSLTGFWIVLFQLVKAPGNALPDFSRYPLPTVALVLVMASLVGASMEEAGFRGYLQGALERRLGGVAAIAIAAVVLAPGHGLTQGFVWSTLLFYFFVDVMFGTTAYLTKSILPGIVVHTVGLLTFFGLIWPHDKARRLIAEGGADTWFWIHAAQAALFLALAILAFRHLARVAGPAPSEGSVKTVEIFLTVFLLGASSSGAASFFPCSMENLPAGAECARIRVPENRSAPGRSLDLSVVRLPALGPGPEAEPVFFLAGGPGDAAGDYSADLPDSLAVLRPTHALVFVDQRGTGRSHPLSCPDGDPSPERVRACRTALEREADLRRYTTEDAVADLDAVREALGYSKIDLFGASYGTLVEQVYLRRYTERVRAAVFVGALPLAPESLLYGAQDAERALHLLFLDCLTEPDCDAAFPRLSAETTAVLERLQKKPVRVRVDGQEVLFDRATFAQTLRTRLFSPEAASRVPLALHQAFEGDYLPMARAKIAIDRAQDRNASLGMFLTVVCSEWAPFVDPAAVRRLGEGTFFGSERTLAWLSACREWPRSDLPADFAAPVRSDVPALILSGRLDPVTPPYWGEQVATFLPKARQVVFAASSHFPESPCASALVAKFLEQGTAMTLDTRCAASETRPPFVVPSSGTSNPP
jgi:pimeloyl-ACP methyl ester carboxylesterase/membrane protease YdiL (CAAX protease family)